MVCLLLLHNTPSLAFFHQFLSLIKCCPVRTNETQKTSFLRQQLQMSLTTETATRNHVEVLKRQVPQIVPVGRRSASCT